MGSLIAGDLALLRQPIDLQKSVERLYLFGTPSIWTGRVNEVPARGDRSITYDGGAMAAGFVFADLTSYGAGLEVWFGSAAGLKDRGVRRLRSFGAAAASGTMTIDWHDEMSLSNDDYITIKHFYPPWPKFSWFTATGPAFRKDGPDGTLYAASGDANDTPAPHVLMGRNYANEMPAAGSIAIQCDATNSVDVAGGGGGVTYAWALTPSSGGTFNNAAIGAPVLTITTAGKYWIHCTVTIDGRSSIGHRAVVVGGGITEFSRSPITTQWDKTDIECQITLTSPETGAAGAIRGVMAWADFQDHSLVIITSEDTYNVTQKSISFRDDGVYTDRQHIVFCGYILLENDDLVEDGTGAVQFTAVSAVDMFLYSQSLTGVVAASQWYEMNRALMTIAGNLLHLFRWHSTLLDIADWWLPWTDTVRRSANEEFGEGDIFERARALCRARLMGMTATPQGEIFVETDLNLRSAADRAAATTTMTLTEADIAGTKRARLRRRGEVARVLADGGYSSGIMNSFQPFFSASANVALAQARPSLMHPDRLMAPSQTEMNRIAARLAAVTNRKYAEVDLSFSGNYREVFSPADQQWTNLGNLFAASVQANIRGDTGLVSAKAVPRSVTHSHDNATGQTTVSAVFDVEAPVELDGRTITPPSVPSEDPGDGTWDMPAPPAYPALPEIAISGSLVAFDNTNGCWVLLPGASDWQERNGTRDSTADEQGGWDPWMRTPAKQNSSEPNTAILWTCQVGRIWRSEDCGVTWLDVTPATDPNNDFSQTPAPTAANVTYVQRLDNIHVNKAHYFLVEYFASAKWGAWLLVTLDDGITWTWYSLKKGGGISDGTYYYVTALYATQVANDTTFHPAGYDNPCFTMTVTNPTNIIGVNDDAVTRFVYNYQHHNGFGQGEIMVDFGATLTTNASGAVQVRNANPYLSANPLFADWVDISGSTDGAAWTVYFNTDTWFNNGALNWAPARTIGARTFRYLRFRYNSALPGGPYAADAGIDAIRVSNVTSASGGAAAEVRPIWGDVDSEAGEFMYLTVCADDTLRLWVLDLSNLGNATPWIQELLGACTQAELSARTWVAFPFTPTFNQDLLYLFGRINHPSLGTVHVIRYTLDLVTPAAGAAVSVLAGLGTDHIGAFRAEGVTDSARTFYAVRNSGAAVPKFWRGLESLAYISDLPFGVGAWVPVDALTVNAAESRVAVGSDTAAAVMIAQSTDDGATWGNATGSFPVTGSVRSLTYV